MPQPREKLATLLWGSHFDAQARQNLRQALFRLRRCWARMPSSATARKSRLRRSIDCDATRLEVLIGKAAGFARRGGRSLQGPPSGRCDIPEEAWADGWLASGSGWRVALDAMVRLGELEFSGHAEALKPPIRAISINDLREDAHRAGRSGAGGSRTQGRRTQALRTSCRPLEERARCGAGCKYPKPWCALSARPLWHRRIQWRSRVRPRDSLNFRHSPTDPRSRCCPSPT